MFVLFSPLKGGLSGNALVSPSGLRETSMFVFSTVQPGAAMALLECPSNERRRRASMHDALDHTQINTSLYERPVSWPQVCLHFGCDRVGLLWSTIFTGVCFNGFEVSQFSSVYINCIAAIMSECIKLETFIFLN